MKLQLNRTSRARSGSGSLPKSVQPVEFAQLSIKIARIDADKTFKDKESPKDDDVKVKPHIFKKKKKAYSSPKKKKIQ